jgi:hypothetical protein
VLFRHAEIDLSDDEKTQLDRFTKYIEWAGQYPTQIDLKKADVDDVLKFDLLEVSKLDWTSFMWFSERIERAFKKASKGLPDLNKSNKNHHGTDP